jgi:hypothetical protein
LVFCTNKELIEIEFKKKTNRNLLIDYQSDSDDHQTSISQIAQQDILVDPIKKSINISLKRNTKEIRRLASHPILPYCKFT